MELKNCTKNSYKRYDFIPEIFFITEKLEKFLQIRANIFFHILSSIYLVQLNKLSFSAQFHETFIKITATESEKILIYIKKLKHI